MNGFMTFKIQTKTPLHKFPSNTHTKPLNSHPAQTYTHTKPSNDHPTHTQTHIKPSNDKIHVQKFVTDLMFSVLSLVEGLAGDAQIIKSGHTDDKIGTQMIKSGHTDNKITRTGPMLCPHDMARYVGSGLGDNEAEASGKALMRNTQLPTVGEGDCFFVVVVFLTYSRPRSVCDSSGFSARGIPQRGNSDLITSLIDKEKESKTCKQK